MAKLKHTPGPWEVCKMDNGYGFQIVSRNPRIYVMGSIAANGAGISGCSGKAKANAQLIAAAPKLLEIINVIIGTNCADAEHVRDYARKELSSLMGNINE